MTSDKARKPVIHPTAKIGEDVEIGDWSTIGANVVIDAKVRIGRSAWIDQDVTFGGGRKERGSCIAGDFFHLGMNSFVNTADRLLIGDEVGLGMDSRLYTHGAYLSQIDGFPFDRGPIVMGSRVWLPNAMVLPNVTIGSDVVVAAMSLVNRDLPSGCLAGGVPARILKVDEYPKAPDFHNVLRNIREDAHLYGIEADYGFGRFCYSKSLLVGETEFNIVLKEIDGPVTKDTERVKDLLRRRGVRFRYYDKGGEYAPWD